LPKDPAESSRHSDQEKLLAAMVRMNPEPMSPDHQKPGSGWPTIMILGATFGTDNLGVSALTAGTVECILGVFPKAEILLLDYGVQPTTYFFESAFPVPISLINMRFSKRFYLKNNVARLLATALGLRLIPGSSRRESWERKNPYLSRIRQSDIIVSLAGGDSFSDIYGLGRLLYVSLPQLLVLALKKPLVLLPQTLGPFSKGIAKLLARFIISQARLVYSRDYRGLEEFQPKGQKQGRTGNLRFCYDVGFAVKPRPSDRIQVEGLRLSDRPSFLVGFNISGLLYGGGYSGRNEFGLKCDYGRLVEKLLDFLIRESQATVLLVPHVLGEGQDSESDTVVSARLYAERKPSFGERLGLVRGRYDQSEIKHIIGGCDFFIGSRMHSCIAAISQYVPTVSIAYSQKFKGVMETVGVAPHVADPRSMDAEEILALVDRALKEREATRRHLQKTMPEVRRRVLELFTEIAREIGLSAESPKSIFRSPAKMAAGKNSL
jgi:colanic acid/amylovoran biosynthesis protein